MRPRQDNNTRIAAEWLERLKRSSYEPMRDIEDYLEHIMLLKPNEKNVPQWIIRSKELNNALSFTTALFATALRDTAESLVLAFFCVHRSNKHPLDNDKSGALGLVKSLNGQLLAFTANQRPMMDLSTLED
ncbi:hypothetical protein AJ80_09093 [Polytolypa hystricis UAMH7299]|uniref:Uncharacterized protein n=1 Tax=Polytolypa hystricis (strain UAMH7299) TaxID=1447883 RepID=A0A2B7WWR8_POLH7|nr:hypothetical protein AJ80_09093 [Polytolypa hystricis UAMH7299]